MGSTTVSKAENAGKSGCSGVPKSPDREKPIQLGFEKQLMVDWYSPIQLAQTGLRSIISSLFGNYADNREMQAALESGKQPSTVADFSARETVWIAYVSDLGLGWNSTYSVAYLLGRKRLQAQDSNGETHDLPSGNMLVVGGDEVYPTATWQQYNNRLRAPEYQTAVKDYIFAEKIAENTLLRFNITNLTTGQNRIFQYPGEDGPIQKAIMASISVPVVFEPVEIDGDQYVDGLAIEGCLLEELLLLRDLDRIFVLSVSPSQPIINPTKSAYTSLLSAMEWNQYSEPLLAIREANEMIENREQKKQSLKQSIGELEIGETEKDQVQLIIDEAVNTSGFPYERDTVQIIPVMPTEPIDMWFGDFKPSRSKELIDKGRKVVLDLLKSEKLMSDNCV